MKRQLPQKDWMRFRFFLFILGFLVAFGMIALQAYRIQIYHGIWLSQEANKLYQRQITLVPTRGSIFDRNGEDLAITIPVDSIYARPQKIEDPASTAKQLSEVLEMDRADVLEKLFMDRPFVWIKRQVVPTVSARVRNLGNPGIGVIQETRRFYPNLELACHLLGFVGVDGKGLEGLEFYYDRLLQGEESRVMVDVDAWGRTLAPRDGLIVARRDGDSLVLTVHKEIQYVAEHNLEAAVVATGSRGGMVVVLNPKTGEILAMANVPRFNPNTFRRYPQELLRNRSVTNTYEPGSTIKPFVVAAVLEEKAGEPSDVVFCENGSFRVFDQVIHDVGRHGWLSIRRIIKQSSNIGAAKLGLSLGAERLHDYFKRFGFARATGIDLPGEAVGIMRPSNMWSPVDLATISFGQGISATALQMAVAFAALGNNGRLMKPFVVKELLDASGNTVERHSPEDLGPMVSPETAHQITKMLIDVVSEGGTGSRAAIEGYEIAGKTGTSQRADLSSGGYQQGRYMASFAGYAPADDPTLCILVVLEEPQGNVLGGQIAAPVFREIAREALIILGIYPDERLLAMASGSGAETEHGTGPILRSNEH
jgi:cell division protein FtsI (penicillin-binding protein 3)